MVSNLNVFDEKTDILEWQINRRQRYMGRFEKYLPFSYTRSLPVANSDLDSCIRRRIQVIDYYWMQTLVKPEEFRSETESRTSTFLRTASHAS